MPFSWDALTKCFQVTKSTKSGPAEKRVQWAPLGIWKLAQFKYSKRAVIFSAAERRMSPAPLTTPTSTFISFKVRMRNTALENRLPGPGTWQREREREGAQETAGLQKRQPYLMPPPL